jgi:hypothetical protein
MSSSALRFRPDRSGSHPEGLAQHIQNKKAAYRVNANQLSQIYLPMAVFRPLIVGRAERSSAATFP